MRVDRRFPGTRSSDRISRDDQTGAFMQWTGQVKGPSKTTWITVALAIATVVIVAWWWQRQIEVRSIEFMDVKYANVNELQGLVPVETGIMMKDVDVLAVTDSVSVHPWVKHAETATRFDGSVEITISEREPVFLVLSAGGRPSYYVDEEGYQMPVVAQASFDVPVVRGNVPGMATSYRVTGSVLRELAHALHVLPNEVNALISEFTVTRAGAVNALTVPGPGGKPFEVRLGRQGFENRLVKLRDFWDQAILPQPDKVFQFIDLRFDGQIVTRESETTN